MRVLLITSKWAMPRKDIDGGCMTSRNILDSIANQSTVDILLPEGFVGINIEGANSVLYYPIDEDTINNYNEANRFMYRIKIAKTVGSIVTSIHHDYDRIIILHIFHAFEICKSNDSVLINKIILFPMLLTPSYIESGEYVPEIYTTYEKRTLCSVKKIITPSRFEQKQLELYYGINSEKIICIPRFVSSIFKPNLYLPKTDSSIILCYIASIKKQKQNHKVVELLKLIVDQGMDVHLYLIGSIQDYHEYEITLRTIEENNLNSYITILHGITQNMIKELYSNAFINISVAKCETFGRSIVEGLYTGLPAFVLNSAECFKDLLGENHGVEYFDSIEDMAARIVYIHNHSSCYYEMRSQALAYSAQYDERIIKPVLQKAIIC